MASYTVPRDSIIEVVLDMRLFGQQLLTVRHYQATPSGSDYTDGAASLEAIAEEVNTNPALFYLKASVIQTTDLKYDNISAQFIYPDRKAYRFVLPGLDAGTAAAPTMVQNTCIPIVLQADNVGRDCQSLIHVPGLPLDYVVDGVVTPAAATALEGLRDGFLEPITDPESGNTLIPVTLKKASPAANQALTHGYVVTSSRVMRRRTVGLGI